MNADSAPAWADMVGTPLAVGDEVRAACVNPDRGVALWMNLGRIVRFGRTRAVVQFYAANGEWSVGTECLRKVPSGTLCSFCGRPAIDCRHQAPMDRSYNPAHIDNSENFRLNVKELPRSTPAGTIDRRLYEMTDGTYFVVAVEIFDAPDSAPATKAEAARHGVGEGEVIGPWVLGTPEDVYAWLKEQGYEDYSAQYGAGYDGEEA